MKKLIILALIITSCVGLSPREEQSTLRNEGVEYAQGFAREKHKNYTKIEVYDPWKNNRVLSKYVFLRDSVYEAASDEIVIHVPIKRGAFMSSTYLGMLSMLDARESVVACTNASWIYDSALFSNYKNGKIKNLGMNVQVNAEKIIGVKPDAVMKYIFMEEDAEDKIIKQVGIPIVYNIEFMEAHPLGRAEWIKVVGALIDKEDEADSIFHEIESKYKALKSLAHKLDKRPSVIDGSSFKGTWYTAGGNSYVGSLLEDANADYYWHSDTSRGSLPISFEVILQKQGMAQYWLNANAGSLNEIQENESRCNLLTAFKEKNVYHFNKRVNINGGFDYYESGVVRPDLLLHDLLVILHPVLFDSTEVMHYYKKLEYQE